jgi:hypothetical protein
MPSSTQILINQTAVMIEALVTFINRGLVDDRRGESFRIDFVAGSLARGALQKMSFNFGLEDNVPQAKYADEACSAAYDAFCRYARYVKGSFSGGASQIAPPMLGNITPEEYKSAIAEVGFDCEPHAIAQDDDPLKAAWRMARSNADRNLQRIAALGFLNSLYRDWASSASQEVFQQEVERASSFLLEKVNEFWANELQFAILCGGDELALTKDRMMKVAFSDNSGLTRYIQMDGTTGMNGRAVTEALRVAIKERVASLA